LSRRDILPGRSHIGLQKRFDFTELACEYAVNHKKAACSIGTLGSGNHFIEVDEDEDGNLYVAVHSGSRHLGKEVTEYYLREGQEYLKKKRNPGTI